MFHVKNNIKGYVYKLVCPITNLPIYVGSTTNAVEIRLSGHIYSSKKSRLPLYEYIRKNEIIPRIEILERVRNRNVLLREKYWTRKLVKSGANILNVIVSNKTEISGSLKIDTKVLDRIRKYCKENGLVIGHFVSEAIREKLIEEKDSRLIHS